MAWAVEKLFATLRRKGIIGFEQARKKTDNRKKSPFDIEFELPQIVQTVQFGAVRRLSFFPIRNSRKL